MFNLKKSLIALIVLLTVYGAEARGDSFVITDIGGVVYVDTRDWGGPPTLKLPPALYLHGPGLSVQTEARGLGDVGNVEARDTCIIIPCTPGMVIGTDSSFSGIIARLSPASATVNGVYYELVEFTGALNFVSSPIVIPNTRGGFRVTLPFTFSGELTGNAFQHPIFTATLSGHGQATFSFEDVAHWFESSRYRLAWIEYKFEPVRILIDIKPATFPNSINPKSKGKIPVAILTNSVFDAMAVDPTTVLFGATGIEAAPVQWATEDVDGDGDLDMVLHFPTQHTGITCGNTYASLTGAIFSGVRIKGFDSIETVPCN